MHFFFLHPGTKDLKDQPDENTFARIHEPSDNMNEGSEFLDDAIRMEDLSIIHTEEDFNGNRSTP